MNHQVFSHLLHNKKNSFDRFIPNRAILDVDYMHHQMNSERVIGTKDILNQKLKQWAQIEYSAVLEENMLKRGSKLGGQGITLWCAEQETSYTKMCDNYHWPTLARRKPSIGTQHAVLDLPNFADDFCMNRMDWGRTDFLAASLTYSVYLWHRQTNSIHRINVPNSCSVKWNPDGSLLAVTSETGWIQIRDIANEKWTTWAAPQCGQLTLLCVKTALEWHPFGRFLVIGCSKGTIKVLNTNLFTEGVIHDAHQGPVITLAFSPDGKYLASSSSDSTVKVWDWPCRAFILEVPMNGPVRAMSWHPWRPSNLCFGDNEGVMKLWSVTRNKCLSAYTPNPLTNAACISMTFSAITGELVTSHRIYAYGNRERSPAPENTTQLNILSSFERVVDKMLGEFGQVLYLVWSPDGAQIATAGADENLHIWNFISNARKYKFHKKPKKFSPSNELNLTHRFGFSIR